MEQKIKDLLAKLQSGDRLALAQVITLLESERTEDQLLTDQLVELWSASGKKSLRVGLTGAPGAGKSSLIEKVGLYFVRQGIKVAVLAIDPSSELTRGSVLGDKTRMEELSAQDLAFIRPSANRGYLGGVSTATHDVVKACEAAGYQLIIVETVGVGQSEALVADLVDVFVLVALPGSGDELQGIKRGILEKVDQVIVNKCDGENKVAAQVAHKQLQSSLSILRGQTIPLFLTSAIYGDGIDAFCENLQTLWKTEVETHSQQREEKRRLQESHWVYHFLDQFVRRELEQQKSANQSLKSLVQSVQEGKTSPRTAARQFLKSFLK